MTNEDRDASREQWWDAPFASSPVQGAVRVPGSKSMTNRALVLGSLSLEPTVIVNSLRSRDSDLMSRSLTLLGVSVETIASTDSDRPSRTKVTRDASERTSKPRQIDCGLSGTVMRFVPPRAALSEGAITFDGDPQSHVRPMRALVDGLTQLGVSICPADASSLPFTVEATGRVRGGEASIDSSSSSQFISGLLLSGAGFDDGLQLTHVGDEVPSLPHLEMTISMLRDAGVDASITHQEGSTVFTVEPGAVSTPEILIEPDLSNAAVFLAAAMVTGGHVTIPQWPSETDQAGDQIRQVFEAMGASFELVDGNLSVQGPQNLEGFSGDLRDIGELTPTIAAVCALAAARGSGSELRGIKHLRGHETDRVSALANELKSLGATVEEAADSITILPGVLHPADLYSYHDHRMATFGAIIGLVVEGVRVENIQTTSKTLPGFDSMWESLVTP